MGRTLLGLWTWLAFGIVSTIGFFICALVYLFTFPFDPQRRIVGRGIRFVGMAMIKCVPAWRFGYLGPLPEKLPERFVCVSNHCSNLDPFLVAHLPWEMKYLAKDVLFKIPSVGWGIRLAGDIPLVRGSTSSVKAAMRKAARYLRGGMPVFIFPEGTRSATGDLLPFKEGAFRLAIEEKAAILPAAVGGTTHALRRGDWRPGTARGVVVVGEPISTEGMTAKDAGALRDKAYQAVSALRERLREQGLA